ncbi:hypothetical protein DICPUDRAFT_32093 [Dictyostelium purpureum]|uniref:FAD-binding PCMH-type domain-containing protein n=1 Tax=Dictyostelium purpureum TaxID=5786 RepID=F0ZIC4_DICPU|nr:uncharacterized protein DICPUDRAFT_32093 [Dictyostelium purpureum]EGC36301.1 hypothetical protein DICPUDRAFT_32093 [Dictyostelium purpureum]|eukprot:XP_003287179.1 hypothetical protein DICPUDRAFT_32093 [Dictyostelium purpureum]
MQDIGEGVISAFQVSIEGVVQRRGSEEYGASLLNRWNLDVQNTPILIVYPKNINDVVKAVNFSRGYGLDFAIKAGGHGTTSACKDGLLIDFSSMKKIVVDPDKRTATVEAGCLLGELDLETSRFGLQVPSGHVSHTGVAGLTLGGGLGHLSRSFGLTVDSLLQVTIVNYKGEVMTVNNETNSDLFFGIKGAGSNYGVVIEFIFQLHPVPNIFLGTFIYPLDGCKEVLVKLGEIDRDPQTPWELSCEISITSENIVILAIYNGKEEDGRPLVEEISKIGAPIVSKMENIKYVDLQKLMNSKVPPGKYYQRGPFLKHSLNSEAVDILLEAISDHPTKTGTLLLIHLGGAVTNHPLKDTSSFPYRNAKYQLIIFSKIVSEDSRELIRQWTFNTHSKLSNKYCYGDYSNTTDGSQHISIIYDHCYDKLLDLKNKYDPTNFFHNNVNIKPTFI